MEIVKLNVFVSSKSAMIHIIVLYTKKYTITELLIIYSSHHSESNINKNKMFNFLLIHEY